MSDADCVTVDAPAYDAVVQDYLDFMLRAVTDPLESAAAARPTSAPDVGAAPRPVIAPVRPAPLEVPAPVCAGGLPEPVAAPPERCSESVTPDATEYRHGKPAWAEDAFSCLLFHVNGLKLVAPLTELGGITEMGELTPIFAQPAWFMGLLRWNGRTIRVIDTARLIMPERTAEGDAHREQYQCVLMLDGSDWGLAIDSDASSLRLRAEDVRWRSHVRTRPWLAGTLAEQLCALLDVKTLTAHLRPPAA